jgi:hypothetical protein
VLRPSALRSVRLAGALLHLARSVCLAGDAAFAAISLAASLNPFFVEFVEFVVFVVFVVSSSKTG